MPLLGFQKRFAPLVESGEKRQTIRAYRKDGRDPKVGDRLYLYTGGYNESRRKMGESVATDVRRIRLEITRSFWIYSLGYRVRMSPEEISQIAVADGFRNLDAMHDYFKDLLPFEGLLIRWGEIEHG